jgi:proprotein convertase subtilisin/kexin type 5
MCLIDCKWNEWLDGEECKPCLSECEQGCLRGTDCRTCKQETCEECDQFESACVECIDGAKFSGGACECEAPTIYSPTEGLCINCISGCVDCTSQTSCDKCRDGYFLVDNYCQECDDSCEICTDETNSCTKCADRFYRHPNVQNCFHYCANWLIPENRTCKPA